jgi:hypothetical protein
MLDPACDYRHQPRSWDLAFCPPRAIVARSVQVKLYPFSLLSHPRHHVAVYILQIMHTCYAQSFASLYLDILR